jgi:hypothetical protein
MGKLKILKVLDSIKENLLPNQGVYAYNQPTLMPLDPVQKGDKPCAFCGSSETLFVGFEQSGSIAGGLKSWEFKCEKCQNYSVYDTEWG